MRILVPLTALIACLTPALRAQDDTHLLHFMAQQALGAIPDHAPALQDNPANAVKLELGQKLYFDPQISLSGEVSCNSCHRLDEGGGSSTPTSTGHAWQTGPRNAPSVFNAIFNSVWFWDGRTTDVVTTGRDRTHARTAMTNEPSAIVDTLQSQDDYRDQFSRAFPDQENPITYDNITRALESFLATLITPRSRFDRFLGGDMLALKSTELAGLRHFLLKGCVSCHSGVNFGGQAYYPFGVFAAPAASVRPPGDHGRFALTNTSDDNYVFRAAPLRNVELTAPYFHSGQVPTLEEAVRVMSSSQLGHEFTDQEIIEIAAFLRTLTGRIPEITVPPPFAK